MRKAEFDLVALLCGVNFCYAIELESNFYTHNHLIQWAYLFDSPDPRNNAFAVNRGAGAC